MTYNETAMGDEVLRFIGTSEAEFSLVSEGSTSIREASVGVYSR